MNLEFPKSNFQYFYIILTCCKIKLHRINSINQCTTPFYMTLFPAIPVDVSLIST